MQSSFRHESVATALLMLDPQSTGEPERRWRVSLVRSEVNFDRCVVSVLRRANALERSARLQGAANLRTSLDFVQLPCYESLMIKSSRKVNFSHMTRFGWAVEGVAR